MSNVQTWAEQVGFRNIGQGVFRGHIHTDHLVSVQKSLTEMGMTCAHSKDGFEIWTSKDDVYVVLINHSQ